jgi:hypothetical protein
MMSKHSLTSVIVLSVAIVISSASTGVAAVVITGKQIKNGSITTVDLANSSVTGAKIKNGSITGYDLAAGVTRQGPQGIQGPQGVQGLRGVQGPAGVVPTFKIESKEVGADTTWGNTATCPSGWTVTGGSTSNFGRSFTSGTVDYFFKAYDGGKVLGADAWSGYVELETLDRSTGARTYTVSTNSAIVKAVCTRIVAQ